MVNTIQPTIALSEILEHHQGGLVFRTEFDPLDRVVATVVLGRSVAARVGIEPGLYLELVLQLFITRFPAHRVGKIQAKSFFVRTHMVDVGGHCFAIINDSLQTALLATPGTPTPTGLPDQHTAVLQKDRTHDAGCEKAGKGSYASLVDALDAFGHYPEQVGHGLVAHEHLALEHSELAAGGVPNRMTGGIRYLAVRKPDRSFANLSFPKVEFQFGRVRVFLSREGNEARQVPIELVLFQGYDFGRPYVLTLVFGVPDATIGIRPQTGRAAQPVGKRLKLPVRGDPAGPS
ncbi:MAG: hypothetical protein HN675_17165, partial [Opitutae bacterium]|nr:hypothetical protein [Opitutae bacterium]